MLYLSPHHAVFSGSAFNYKLKAPFFCFTLKTLYTIRKGYNMVRRDLPDIYARARGRVCIYQANPDRPCYKHYITLPAL